MAESKHFLPSWTSNGMAADRLAFHVVLRDVGGLEALDSRSFELVVGGAPFPIGRASKNTTKKVLMPAAHNAFIDSPVISRAHAVMFADATVQGPQVFVTDTGSMHGTMVNGERLVANIPKQLSSGDMLQFGIDVNRNEGGCTPPSHRLWTMLTSPAEFFVARKYNFAADLTRHAAFSLGFTVPDSEGEVVDVDACRGSQSDPHVLEESDSNSDSASNVSEDEDRQVTMIAESPPSDDDIGNDDDDDEPLSVINGALPSVHDMMSIMPDLSDNEDSIEDYSSSGQDELDSAAYDSDIDLAETKPETFSSLDSGYGPPDPSYPSQELLNQSGSWYTPAAAYTLPPPIPPRPTVAFSTIFDHSALHSNSDFGGYIGTNHGDHPSLFSPAPIAVSAGQDSLADQITETQDMVGASAFPPPATADRIQTPPLMPASDVMTPTPPPNRRTKVSITEIVEEQPPTPSSVNGTKRKADVFDNIDPHIPAELVTDETQQSLVMDTPTQTAAVIAQRPKKQPKSILRKASTAAKYLGISAFGAVSAVAVVLALPDAFFVLQ
jgi:hypothetical protein